jgi:hypothetical protein
MEQMANLKARMFSMAGDDSESLRPSGAYTATLVNSHTMYMYRLGAHDR